MPPGQSWVSSRPPPPTAPTESRTWSSTPLWASTLGQGFLALPCSSSTLGTIL